jgi:predicted nucleotidyltransferase
MNQIDESVLEDMARRLIKEFTPDQIILFGSQAWGTPSDDSDIDLYVIVPQSAERPLQRARRAHTCLHGIRKPVDILVRTQSEADKNRQVFASLECQIFEKGRILYERR